jgi:hypothetical protein
LFAAPHGLSQRTTSFIACACLGIHRTPLLHLITLILDARLDRRAQLRPAPAQNRNRPGKTSITRTARMRRGHAPQTNWSALPLAGERVRTTLLFTMSHQQAAADERPLQTNFSRQATRLPHHEWWSQTGSNRRPPACKAGALPTELWPRKPCPGTASRTTGPQKRELVGLGRFELPTSPLSGVRSNQLSYRPSPRTNVRKARAPGVIRTRYRS